MLQPRFFPFFMNESNRFKVMFSSMLEKGKEYPDFAEMSQKAFRQVVAIVASCQDVGVLRDGAGELTAVTTWSAVHGLIALLQETQIPPKNISTTPRKQSAKTTKSGELQSVANLPYPNIAFIVLRVIVEVIVKL